MKIRKFIKNHWKFLSVCVTFALLASLLGINISTVNSLKSNQVTVGKAHSEFIVTIGSSVEAAGISADYICSGVNDNVQWQNALNALPASGGEIQDLTGGAYNFTGNVTRAIPNVMICGTGMSTTFSGNSPDFTVGGNGWTFENLSTNSGGISTGSYTYLFSNVEIGSTVYNTSSPVATAPTGRTASYVIAASNSSAADKAQADVTLTTSDLRTALTAAFTALNGQGIIHLMAGAYTMNGSTYSVPSTAANIIIEGSGKGTVISTDGSYNMFQMNGPANVTFRNIRFHGAAGTSYGIQAYSGSPNCVVDNCWFDNWYVGVCGSGTNNLTVSNCQTTNNLQTAIYFYQCTNSVMTNNYSYLDAVNGNSYAMAMDLSGSAGNNKIIGNTVVSSNSWGIGVLNDNGTLHSQHSLISLNTVSVISTSVGGIEVLNTANIDCLSNTIFSVAATNNQMGISTAGTTNSNISNNMISGFDRPIWAQGTSYCNFISNQIAGIGASAQTWTCGIHLYDNAVHNTVSLNEIWSNGYAGIGLQGSVGKLCQYNTITGNKCYDDGAGSQNYGIAETSTYTNNNYIKDNTVIGNVTAGVLIYGAGTVATQNPGYNPVGLIANPIGTASIGLGGSGATVTSATVYTVQGTDCFITSTDSSNTNNSIVIQDAGATLVTYTHTCANILVPIGYTITFTFTGTAPVVTVFGN